MPNPWPCTKFKTALASADIEHKRPAVLVCSGAFSPCHRSHVQMMWQAKERLERAGFAVLAGWLSVWGDGAALEKSCGFDQAKFSATLRVRLAELTVESDEFLSIGQYETDDEVDAASAGAPHVIAPALSAAIQVEFGAQLNHQEVQVFIVYGSDEAKEQALHQHQYGRVIVPRGDELVLDKVHQRVYAADAIPGKGATLSATLVCQALLNRDLAFLSWAMAPAAVQLVYGGASGDFEIDADLGEFLGEGPPPAEPWPSAKFHKFLAAPAKVPEEQIVAVLVTAGTMSPTTKSHAAMMHAAKERLERVGYKVCAGYLIPADSAVASEDELSLAFRQKIAELSVCDDELLSVTSLEAVGLPTEGKISPRELVASVRQSLAGRFKLSLDGLVLQAFYVVGTDDPLAKQYTKTWAGNNDGVVVVPFEDGPDDIFLEDPHRMIWMADSLPGEGASRSSSALRAMIKAADTMEAAQAMAPAAARFTLAPIPGERKEFEADFAKLGVTLPKDAEMVAARERLKGALQSWIGPTKTINVQDLERLLKILDPSWTSEQLAVLTKSMAKVKDGACVMSDEFVDWVFGCGQQ